MSLAGDLCALARRYLARTEREFAEAVTGGDCERAEKAIGEAAALSEALQRQERAATPDDIDDWEKRCRAALAGRPDLLAAFDAAAGPWPAAEDGDLARPDGPAQCCLEAIARKLEAEQGP